MQENLGYFIPERNFILRVIYFQNKNPSESEWGYLNDRTRENSFISVPQWLTTICCQTRLFRLSDKALKRVLL